MITTVNSYVRATRCHLPATIPLKLVDLYLTALKFTQSLGVNTKESVDKSHRVTLASGVKTKNLMLRMTNQF